MKLTFIEKEVPEKFISEDGVWEGYVNVGEYYVDFGQFLNDICTPDLLDRGKAKLFVEKVESAYGFQGLFRLYQRSDDKQKRFLDNLFEEVAATWNGAFGD